MLYLLYFTIDIAVFVLFLYNTHMKIRVDKRKGKWLLGVSGGADSMALLAMCIEAQMDIMVAHMNYQKRDSANRDMLGVQAYCEEHHVPCIVKYQEKNVVGNFQAFARKERYLFYREIIDEYALDGVFVAHHLDDHLETYLMQKQRKSIPSYYGIQEETSLFGCRVVRPLLEYPKSVLEKYCDEQEVPFYIDESNLSDNYTRNYIRHHALACMSMDDKLQMVSEIDKLNQEQLLFQRASTKFLTTWKQTRLELSELSKIMFQRVMQEWIYSNCEHHISEREIQTLYEMMKVNHAWVRPLDEFYQMRHAYGIIYIEKCIQEEFSFEYSEITYEETPYFICAKEGERINAVTITTKDLPITIRSFKPQDAIVLRLGTKKLNRWFIDRKIPPEERKKWPVVENAEGKIILVPKIGCDISHFSNNPNLFVIK